MRQLWDIEPGQLISTITKDEDTSSITVVWEGNDVLQISEKFVEECGLDPNKSAWSFGGYPVKVLDYNPLAHVYLVVRTDDNLSRFRDLDITNIK